MECAFRNGSEHVNCLLESDERAQATLVVVERTIYVAVLKWDDRKTDPLSEGEVNNYFSASCGPKQYSPNVCVVFLFRPTLRIHRHKLIRFHPALHPRTQHGRETASDAECRFPLVLC